MEIRPFAPGDLGAAAALWVATYAEQRRRAPALPASWEEPGRISRLIEELVGAGPALAAAEGDRLVGYLGGWIVDRGDEPRIYVPEWGHGVSGPDRRRVWEELYAALLPDWLGRGARLHQVTLLADDELVGALDWLSFGTTTVDALRGTDAIGRGRDRYAVRRATDADTDAVVGLRDSLRRHLQSSPVYLYLPTPIDPATERAKLADPAIATFLAEVGGEVTGFLRIGPPSDAVATIVQDPGTASITGAFTVAERRGAGIAHCLLDEALAWARAEGYVRVAVDFETMNLLAARFWTATFQTVAVTMSRAIDWRIQATPSESDPARR
jgi:GNAT superfamily N-acetyltransferase